MQALRKIPETWGINQRRISSGGTMTTDTRTSGHVLDRHVLHGHDPEPSYSSSLYESSMQRVASRLSATARLFSSRAAPYPAMASLNEQLSNLVENFTACDVSLLDCTLFSGFICRKHSSDMRC